MIQKSNDILSFRYIQESYIFSSTILFLVIQKSNDILSFRYIQESYILINSLLGYPKIEPFSINLNNPRIEQLIQVIQKLNDILIQDFWLIQIIQKSNNSSPIQIYPRIVYSHWWFSFWLSKNQTIFSSKIFH